MPQVLLLDLSLDPNLYRPRAHWSALLGPALADTIRPPAGEALPADPRGFSHLLLSGSEASIVSPEPWFEPVECFVRRAVDAGLAVLGSCFGHQMIARALRGPEAVRRAATPEFGWFALETTAGGAPTGAPGRRIHTFCCHLDEVAHVPPDFETIARTPACAVHIMRHRHRPVWGVQAHPEIDPAEGQALLRGFAAARADLGPILAPGLEAPPRDDGFGPELVAAFLEAAP